jgi:hypothetical protein
MKYGLRSKEVGRGRRVGGRKELSTVFTNQEVRPNPSPLNFHLHPDRSIILPNLIPHPSTFLLTLTPHYSTIHHTLNPYLSTFLTALPSHSFSYPCLPPTQPLKPQHPTTLNP